MPKFHPLTKLLAAGAAVAVPYLIWTAPESGPAAAVSTSDAALAAELLPRPTEGVPSAATSLPPLSVFEATIERPLFSPTRRLDRPDAGQDPVELDMAAIEPAPGQDEPALKLLGTMRQNAEMVALVSLDDSDRMERLEVGAAVGDWRVVEIDRNRLTLDLEGERRDYTLFSSFEEPGAAPAIAPAPPDAGEEASQVDETDYESEDSFEGE